MSFYKQVRTFFLKNDPARVHTAKRIAVKFKSKSAQQLVMKRLAEVYRNGGPSNIKIIPKVNVPKVQENTTEEE